MDGVRDTAIEIARGVRARERSAVDVTRAALDAIAKGNGAINAFVQVFEARALKDAEALDARIAAAREGMGRGESSEPAAALPLAGVPVAIKDNICLAWGRTTCASRILEKYESPYTATAAQKLIDAGAIVVGKTNLDEFAMGGSTEHSCFGATRNPHDHARIAGGSSGGSAASVAAGFTPIALGSDTGGSVRQPASHCGVVGVKPTYGRVSRFGLVAYASSLDQIGTMATNVADAAAVLEAICGEDPRDATSTALHACDFTGEIERAVDGLTLGVPTQARSDSNHADVAGVLDETIRAMEKAGAKVVPVELPMSDAGIAAYYIVATAEASSNLARFDGVRYGRRAELLPGEGLQELYSRSRSEGFGDEVKRRIMLGTHVLSSGYYDAYYLTALKARRKILEDFQRAFAGGCHAILMPNAPSPAFKIGEKSSDPLALYLEDVYTVGVNLAGLPAVSVPAGFASIEGKKLPIGMQVVSPAFDEATMLRVGRMIERAMGA